MKKSILFCISIFFFISCSNKKNNRFHYFDFNKNTQSIKIAEFEEVKKIEIPDNSIIKYEFKVINDSILRISGFKTRTNILYTYFVNTKNNKIIIDTLDFKYNIVAPIDFGYTNKDSIFLLYLSSQQQHSYHDSILLLINNKGDIKKSYSFDDIPVFSMNHPEYGNDDEAVYLTYNFYEPFTFINNKIFIHFENKANILGDPAYSNTITAGIINTKTEKIQPIKLKYPDVKYGKTFFAGYNKHFVSTLGKKDHILYGFLYTPTILDYNYKKLKFEKHFIKSTVYDTIYPSLTEKGVAKGFVFDSPQPKYFNLLYDKYRKLYFRVIMSPPENKEKLSVVIADERFNFVAEGFLPNSNNVRFFFTKDYIVSIGNKENASKGKEYLTFYKLKYKNGTNQELISKIKANKKDIKLINKPITHYLKKNTNIKDKNNTTTFMYYEMCPKVREFVLGFYQFNKTKLEKANVNLVLVTENVQSLKNDLKQFNLLPKNNSNIFIDSTYAFASYNGNKRNDLPRIVTIRNKKIVTDTVFNNDDGKFHKNFQKFLIKSGKEQEALKEK